MKGTTIPRRTKRPAGHGIRGRALLVGLLVSALVAAEAPAALGWESTPTAAADPDRPPGSGDSTDDVSDDVPSPPPTECEPFRYRQLYRSWGPAKAFGRKVSVLYQAERCVTIENGILRISMDGTAQIREGNSRGRIIAKRPFELEGTWIHPSNTSGWPPDWWECSVADLDYTWRIRGRYSFEVEAEDGRWALDVITVRGGKTRTVHWAYNACR